MEYNHLHLFEGFGINISYMITDRHTLSVSPVADELLRTASGGDCTSHAAMGALTLSSELVLHRVELATSTSVSSLAALPAVFTEAARSINALLDGMDAQLMPGAMHPWMNPRTETNLWAHDASAAHKAFSRMFDCRTHDWANQQGTSIALPFYDDREFARLHAAVRLVLPIVPALAASSPVVNGTPTDIMDNRLEVHRTRTSTLPSLSGRIIPEQVFTRKDYEREILQRIDADRAPRDPENTLRSEWLNARGAVAQFDRNIVEIRMADAQECALADISVAAAIIAVVEALTGEFSANLILQQAWETDPLYTLLIDTIKDAESAIISNAKYLRLMRYPEGNRCRASELWQHLIETVLPASSAYSESWEMPLHTIIAQGTLARRISRALGKQPERGQIAELYGQLRECLVRETMFRP